MARNGGGEGTPSANRLGDHTAGRHFAEGVACALDDRPTPIAWGWRQDGGYDFKSER